MVSDATHFWSKAEPNHVDDRRNSLMKDGHPYITTAIENCHWKLIPHGNNLYTVQNIYKCPKYGYCEQYLSFDILSGEDSRLTLKTYADLWEICGVRQKR